MVEQKQPAVVKNGAPVAEQRYVLIDKELREQAYAYLQKAVNSLVYLPVVIMVFPIVALLVLIAASISFAVLLPAAILWGAFAYWFPQYADAVLDFIRNFWGNFMTFLLRIRETIRSFAWENLNAPSVADGKQLAPFFGEIIDSSAEFLSGSRNALPQPADIKKALEDFLPGRISRGLKEL